MHLKYLSLYEILANYKILHIRKLRMKLAKKEGNRKGEGGETWGGTGEGKGGETWGARGREREERHGGRERGRGSEERYRGGGELILTLTTKSLLGKRMSLWWGLQFYVEKNIRQVESPDGMKKGIQSLCEEFKGKRLFFRESRCGSPKAQEGRQWANWVGKDSLGGFLVPL